MIYLGGFTGVILHVQNNALNLSGNQFGNFYKFNASFVYAAHV